MTHTSANRFKKRSYMPAKTPLETIQNDYLSRIEATSFPKVSVGKSNIEKISVSESAQKIFSKSAMGYAEEGSIQVHDQEGGEVDNKKNPF